MSYTVASTRTATGTRETVLPIQADWTPPPLTSGSGFLATPPQHGLHRSKTGRKPLRSSPLAGPAISNDRLVSLSETEEDGKEAYLPRVSSSPALPVRPMSCQIRPKSSQSLTRPRSIISISSLSSSPIPPVPELPRTRPSTAPGPSSRRPLSEGWPNRPPSAMTVYSPIDEIVSNPIPDRITSRQQQGSPGMGETSAQGRNPPLRSSYASLIGNGLSSAAQRPVSVVIEAHLEAEGQESQSASAKDRPDSHVDNSWYTANAYDVTPKFSRLGLAASNVVMPISAKAHKRQSQSHLQAQYREASTPPAGDGGMTKRASMSFPVNLKRKSTTTIRDAAATPGEPLPRSQSAAQIQYLLPSPRPSFTISPSSSAASSSSSLPLSSPPTSSQAPSIISSSRTSVNDSEETTTQHYGQAPKHIFSISGKGINKRKSVIYRMKSWRHPPSPQDSEPIDEKSPLPRSSHGGTADFPSSVHDLRESLPSVDTAPATMSPGMKSGGKKDGKSDRDRRTDGQPVLEAVSAPDFSKAESRMQNYKLRKTGTVRRLWNALVGNDGGGH